MPLQFNIEVAVLLFPVSEYAFLVIDFVPEVSYEQQVSVYPALVVIVHSAFLIVKPVKVRLQGQQLVLEGLVVALTLSEFGGFLLELGYQSVFVICHLVWASLLRNKI